MTLIEFLEARLAEDQAVAEAAHSGPWRWEETLYSDGSTETWDLLSPDEWEADSGHRYPTSIIEAIGMHTEGYIDVEPADREHIARFDPARVLAECASRRAIIAIHERSEHRVGGFTLPLNTLVFRCRACHDTNWPCPTLLALAAPYSSHPDCPDLGGVG